MNGVFLKGGEARKSEAIDKFLAAANKMNRKIDIVQNHRKLITEKQVRLLQMAENAPAIDLILKSNGNDLDAKKTEAFLGLLTLVSGTTIDETRQLYHDIFEDEQVRGQAK